jgi:hypothetical protein
MDGNNRDLTLEMRAIAISFNTWSSFICHQGLLNDYHIPATEDSVLKKTDSELEVRLK